MAEWSNAAVLKTVEGHTSGGSNPSFSAKENPLIHRVKGFFALWRLQTCQEQLMQKDNKLKGSPWFLYDFRRLFTNYSFSQTHEWLDI